MGVAAAEWPRSAAHAHTLACQLPACSRHVPAAPTLTPAAPSSRRLPNTGGEEHGADEDAPLERTVDEEQAAADLAAIRSMWELAAVYDFLGTFKRWLGLSQLYPAADLEVALVRSPGPGVPAAQHCAAPHRSTACSVAAIIFDRPLFPSALPPACAPGLLAQLHIDLLRGIATRTPVGPDNWTSMLASRLAGDATALDQPLDQLPFRPRRGREPAAYAALGAVQR